MLVSKTGASQRGLARAAALVADRRLGQDPGVQAHPGGRAGRTLVGEHSGEPAVGPR